MLTLLLILSGILVGIVYLIEKRLALGKYHPATILVAISVLDTFFALPILFYQFQIPTNPIYWFVAIISIFVYGFACIFGFTAYKDTDVSVVGVISKLNIAISAIIGILWLREVYTISAYVGLGLIIIGGIIVTYNKKKFRFNAGIMYSLFMASGYGIAAVLDKVILNEFSPFTYVFVNSFGVGILFATIFPTVKHEVIVLLRTQFTVLFVVALFNIISWVLFLFVLKHGQVSVIFPVYDGISLIVTVGAGIVWLREKSNVSQKLIGLIAVIIGIMLLR